MSYLGQDLEAQKLAERAYNAASAKQKFMEAVKNHSSVIVSIPNDPFLDGYKKCLEMYALTVDISLLTVQTGFGLYMLLLRDPVPMRTFLKEQIVLFEEEAKKRAQNAKPTPAKVLTKMVALRLQKILKHAADQKAYSQRTVENYKVKPAAPGWQQEQLDKAIGFLKKPQLDLAVVSRDQYSNWADGDGAEVIRLYPDSHKDLQAILDRTDVTDGIVTAAGNMLLVGEVMES